MNERIGWIDSWKGILIFLVVLGHVVGGLAHYTTGSTQALMGSVYKAIYLFHMPAFFIVVGWMNGLRDASDTSAWSNFLKRRARRLLVPYAFWGVISACIYLILVPYFGNLQQSSTDAYYRAEMATVGWWRPFLSLLHAGGWPNGEGFRCNSVLWFLPCMFMTLIARKFLPIPSPTRSTTQPLKHLLAILIFFALGAFLRFHVGALPWGLDRVPRFLGFILVGEFLSQSASIQLPRENHKALVPALAFTLTIGYLAVAREFPDLSVCWLAWKWYTAEILMAIWGSIAALLLAKSLDCRALQATGIASLGIMVIHKFPVLALQLTYSRFSNPEALPLLAFAFIAAAAITALCLLAAQLTTILKAHSIPSFSFEQHPVSSPSARSPSKSLR